LVLLYRESVTARPQKQADTVHGTLLQAVDRTVNRAELKRLIGR